MTAGESPRFKQNHEVGEVKLLLHCLLENWVFKEIKMRCLGNTLPNYKDKDLEGRKEGKNQGWTKGRKE